MVIDWDYLNVAQSKKVPGWKVIIPHNAAVAGYYFQAINKDAPHPAAARLWQEFLYSDQGQNLYLAGGARPVRADSMVTKAPSTAPYTARCRRSTAPRRSCRWSRTRRPPSI